MIHLIGENRVLAEIEVQALRRPFDEMNRAHAEGFGCPTDYYDSTQGIVSWMAGRRRESLALVTHDN